MIQILQVRLKKKIPSKELKDILDSLGPDFEELETKVSDIFALGKAEGFILKEHYTDRTIQRVLPDTAKGKPRGRSSNSDKMSLNEREFTASNATEPTFTKQAQQRQLEPELETEEDIQQEFGKFQIKPEEYLLEDLHKYDKDLLIKIVKYLDKNIADLSKSCMKWDKQVRDTAIENKMLKEKIKALEAKK